MKFIKLFVYKPINPFNKINVQTVVRCTYVVPRLLKIIVELRNAKSRPFLLLGKIHLFR